MSAPHVYPNAYYRLRTSQVNDLIRSQGLKKWWVAEFAGVHKTTLRRWLNGRIGKVRGIHVENLARVLTTPSAGIADKLTPTRH